MGFLPSVLLFTVVLLASGDVAADQRIFFDIPPQRADTALTAFARQSELTLIIPFDLARTRQANGLSGDYSIEEAIKILLEGTGLQATFSSHGQLKISINDPSEGNDMHNSAIRAGGFMAFLASVFSAAPGAAQEQLASTQATGIEEVVVTAQKREENLQQTPISIAVLGSMDLEKQGISNLGDFASGVIPSLRVAPTSGRTSSMTVAMRGLSPGDPMEIALDPVVGIYLDGVYLGRVQGLGTAMLDLERIEVLRGPQGTLFGRNAVGGAISMVSKRPTGEFGLDVTAGIRNYNGRNAKINLDLPEVAGFSVKVTGALDKRDGWVENSLQGAEDWYSVDRHGVRASVLWQPADQFSVLYAYDDSRDKSTIGYAQIDHLEPGAAPLPPIFALETRRVRHGRAGVPLEPSVGEVSGHSLDATWDLTDQLTLRSISSYRKLSQTQFDNSGMLLIPYMPNGVFSRLSYAEVKQDQYSQEFQLLGTFDNFNFIVGAFYFKEDAENLAHSAFTAMFNADGTDYTLLPFSLGGPAFPERSSYLEGRSKAIFGQGTYGFLDDRLRLTLGLRWTSDDKRGGLDRISNAPTDIPFDFSSSRIDPAATLAYDWSDAVNTYLRWGRAYRAGGANSRSTTFRTFDDEEVSTWELGVKTEWLDQRLRVNLAVYHTRYSDRQVGFVNPANPSNWETLNAPGSTTIKGLELDIQAKPTPRLTLAASYTLTKWDAVSDVNPFSGDLQDGVVSFSPEHSSTASMDYELPFLFGKSLIAHLSLVNSSSFYTGGASAPKSSSYTLSNARLTIEDIEVGSTGATLSLSLWGKNLSNTQYETYRTSYVGPGLSNVTAAVLNEPRTVGVEAVMRF